MRKRGFDENLEEGTETLDALKAGQVLLSYVHHDPVRAKRDSDSIFTEFYYKVFGKVDVDGLVLALEWYNLIEERKRTIRDDIRIKGTSRTDDTFVTYAGFHILMLCNLLGPSVSKDERPRIIDQAIEIIGRQLDAAGSPAHYSFFRDAKQCEALRTLAIEPMLI